MYRNTEIYLPVRGAPGLFALFAAILSMSSGLHVDDPAKPEERPSSAAEIPEGHGWVFVHGA